MPAIRTALVIGGGIAGPVTATALARAGIRATVHEAYPEVSNGIGSALALAPNGLAALDILGAGDAVRAAGLPITESSMSIGGRTVPVPAPEGLEPLRMIDRGRLHGALHDTARAAGVRYEFGRQLVSVDEYPDRVTARFADGSQATADILIGADGVRSTVRRIIDPGAPDAGSTGLLGFGALVDADIPGGPGTMTFAFGRRAYYLYWKTVDGRTAWGVNLPSADHLSLRQAREIPAGEWLARIRETYRGDEPGEALAHATTARTLEVLGAIHIMPPVPHWYRDRLVLVGDAVHAPSNSTGQGASLAIESSIELARCLRDLPDPAAAFEEYERLRRDRVERITRRGARMNHTKTPGPVGRGLLRFLMPLAIRAMSPERTQGWIQRHRIDWDARVRPLSAEAGTPD
ncbi:FAD-dependent oxidoreductase [Nakamurella endophytica]|uniref:FAD-dependent oxidoreductase n=1 Tax=Nakamurella endophytica TaxID=1748367 RepID=A0A917WE18_9ACTN|nr:NAD(P)/FAD-dependent oxidoreductase [Nakamurella endophytica]GGL98641.1 FAD-dependent oxidoreductase [Nakamurella endophytica]